MRYRIETRTQYTSGWTDEGIGAQNEFVSASLARCAVRGLGLIDGSFVHAEYRIVGPNGIESAEMDGPAWQLAIGSELSRLGLSDESNGRSAMVCRVDDDGAVLADVEDWCKPMAPAELCAILEAIDADQSSAKIRAELASELFEVIRAHEYRCCAPSCPGYPYKASDLRHPCR